MVCLDIGRAPECCVKTGPPPMCKETSLALALPRDGALLSDEHVRFSHAVLAAAPVRDCMVLLCHAHVSMPLPCFTLTASGKRYSVFHTQLSQGASSWIPRIFSSTCVRFVTQNLWIFLLISLAWHVGSVRMTSRPAGYDHALVCIVCGLTT